MDRQWNKKHIFSEIDFHLIEDKTPSLYLNKILKSGIMENQYPLTLLKEMALTEQEPKHHPEGSVWNHTMLVIDECSKHKKQSKNPRVFMWAGLLHDIGKASTTKIRKGRITSYDHDKAGAILCADFLKEFTEDNSFISEVSKLVKWHMQILYVVKNLPFAEIKNMASEVDIEEVALFSLCDRLGRGGADNRKAEEENIQLFIKICKNFLGS